MATRPAATSRGRSRLRETTPAARTRHRRFAEFARKCPFTRRVEPDRCTGSGSTQRSSVPGTRRSVTSSDSDVADERCDRCSPAHRGRLATSVRQLTSIQHRRDGRERDGARCLTASSPCKRLYHARRLPATRVRHTGSAARATARAPPTGAACTTERARKSAASVARAVRRRSLAAHRQIAVRDERFLTQSAGQRCIMELPLPTVVFSGWAAVRSEHGLGDRNTPVRQRFERPGGRRRRKTCLVALTE